MIIANALLSIILELLNLYWWVVFLAAIVSNLVAFNVINSRNSVVWAVIDILERLTEPALRQIRRFMPRLGGIDLSPLILLLSVSLAKAVVLQVFVYGVQIVG